MADSVAVFSPGQRLTNTVGDPIPGGYCKFYTTGDTPLIVYADQALSTALGVTVHFDSAGYPVTAENGTTKTLVYTGTASYKVVIYDENDVVVAQHNDCKGAVVSGAGGGGSSGISQDAADLRYVRNPNALSSVASLTAGDKIAVWAAASSGNRQIDWADVAADLLSEWRTAGYIFSPGVRLLFQQTTPPTGWVKETGAAYENAALRMTTGTAGTGGSSAFTSVFVSKTPSGSLGSYTLTATDIPSHSHSIAGLSTAGAGYAVGPNTYVNLPGSAGSASSQSTGSVGGGGAHTHSLTLNAMDFATKYVDACIGVKS